MNYPIIDEPLEKLIVQPGGNDTTAIVHKRRANYSEDWVTKIVVLNRREALLMNRAITQIILKEGGKVKK